MRPKQILLCVDGSRESSFAAQLACNLAKSMSAKVVVQTVIDSEALWQAIGQGTAGLIGSGPYVAAHDNLRQNMRSIAEALHSSFAARAEALGIPFESVIDDGAIVREINTRANDSDVVVIGHGFHQNDDGMSDARFRRVSICELLVQHCPKPLFIIQGECKSWLASRFVVSAESYDKSGLESFIEMTAPLNVYREVVCVGPAHRINELVERVRGDLPLHERVRIAVRVLTSVDDLGEFVIDSPPETLVVLATSEYKGLRRTIEGAAPERFVRYLALPSLVLLPNGVSAAEPVLQLEKPQTVSVE